MKRRAGGKKRVLLAEDEPGVQKMTKFRLEHEGFEVQVVGDGEEALRQARTPPPPHVVLLDVWIPKHNGYDVCRKLKEEPATARIPVIIFTASEAEVQYLTDKCIEVGAEGWIKKPFRAKELIDKINGVLGKEGEGHE